VRKPDKRGDDTVRVQTSSRTVIKSSSTCYPRRCGCSERAQIVREFASTAECAALHCWTRTDIICKMRAGVDGRAGYVKEGAFSCCEQGGELGPAGQDNT